MRDSPSLRGGNVATALILREVGIRGLVSANMNVPNPSAILVLVVNGPLEVSFHETWRTVRSGSYIWGHRLMFKGISL